MNKELLVIQEGETLKLSKQKEKKLNEWYSKSFCRLFNHRKFRTIYGNIACERCNELDDSFDYEKAKKELTQNSGGENGQ